MNHILFYDCFAGISGDMNLAALIDLGVDQEYLLNELKKLHLEGYEIKIRRDIRKGISGTRVDVVIDEQPHSVLQVQPHQHEHRSFADIQKMIEKSSLSEFVKTNSIAIFHKLAVAEGKIHDKPTNEVHFHEVGAVDSIVDIVGAALCIDFLKPAKILASRIELGSGMVKCAHGLFPVPAPATLEVLKDIPVKTGAVSFEATTPTGAAILAVMVNEFVEKQQITVEKTAYGIGHKDGEIPNVLRVMWCRDHEGSLETETTTLLECNIDDMNPEVYDYLFEKLFREGADDVYVTPIIMKKSRPASILTVMCDPEKKNIFIKILLKETSTLGIRTYEVTKHKLFREIMELETKYGIVRVKKSWSDEGILKFKPEYEDCARIAKEKNIPLLQVMEEAKETAHLVFRQP
jgi:pyridinium-3,5-bisthiocarboxylic acid mononucleotide nickel chelatase